MPVTLKHLATTLGLDTSTVAYALSGKGSIKESTRQRVQQAARELGYVPNQIARRMRSRRTQVIGLVVPDVVLAYNELVQQIFRGAIERQYEVQIALSEFNDELEDRAVRSLLESRVDGMIVKSKYGTWDEVPDGHALRQVVEQKVPCVSYSYTIDGSSLPTYQLPVRAGARLLTEHLLSLGHRRFAWLFPTPTPLVRSHTYKLAGTRDALAAVGLDADEVVNAHVLEGAHGDNLMPRVGAEYDNYINQSLPRVGVRWGRQLMREAMARSPRPTAVMCHNEVTAIGAILEAQEMGLRVPQDVAIAAANRTVATDLAPISLTTVDAARVDAARVTLDLLFHVIEGRPLDHRTRTSEPTLEVGRSTQF